jgi:hypothetical protein
VTSPPSSSETAQLKESLALLVAEHQSMIDRYARPHLRGTPFHSDEVYSKIQYDIVKGNGWLLRLWEDNNGSFDNVEAALVRAVQYVLKSLANKWSSQLRRFTDEDYLEANLRSEATISPQEDWVNQHGQRQEILYAVAHAGLTEAEACLVRAQLADLNKGEVDLLVADALRRGDPAKMPYDTRERFETYRRQIQCRAYAKLRFYLSARVAEGGGGDEE